nr:MAG TPA: homing endonuclease [Caudoviricetes sp.]
MRLLDELIWEHFNHTEIPYQHELRHIDGDDWNCALDNLELVDLREEFVPIKEWPVFGVSRNAEVINFSTNHRIATRFREDRDQMVVSFRAEGQTRTMLLQTTVWRAFNGEIPDGHYIGYKDEDKENCSLDNLVLRKNEGKPVKPRRSRWDPDENGFMPIDYYINMKDGVKGAVESGIPQHCRVVL